MNTKTSWLEMFTGIFSFLLTFVLVLLSVLLLFVPSLNSPPKNEFAGYLAFSLGFSIILVFCGIVAIKKVHGRTRESYRAFVVLIILSAVSFISDAIDLLIFDGLLVNNPAYFAFLLIGITATAVCLFVVARHLLTGVGLTTRRIRKWVLYAFLAAAGFFVLATLLINILFIGSAQAEKSFISYDDHPVVVIWGIALLVFLVCIILGIVALVSTYVYDWTVR